MIVLLCLALAGCEQDMPTKSLTADVVDLDFGFVESSDTADPDFSNAQKYSSLRIDTIYFLRFEFSFIPRTTNYGDHTVDAEIIFENIDVLNGRMEEVGSGEFDELVFHDDMGNQTKQTTVTFTLPEQKDAFKTIQILLRLTPVNAGSSYIRLRFASDNTTLAGDDVDGYTKNITVERMELEQPQLTVDGGSIINFIQVKNADYYKLIVDGEVLTVDNKEYIIEADKTVAPGNTCSLSLSSLLLPGTHLVGIQAFSNSANYLTSAESVEKVVTI